MKRMLAIMLLALVAMQGIAMAENAATVVSGKINAIDTQANSVKLNVKDAATGTESESTIFVNAETKYATVASLAELKQGDEISAEVKKDEATGNWWATSIKIGAAEEEAAPAAAETPAAPAAQ